MVGLGRTIALIIFLVLNFILAILLESKMTANYTLELVIIVIGILLSIAVLLGMSFEARWSWPVSTILFSAFLANAIFLYIASNEFVAFTGLVLVNTLGLLTSVLSIGDYDDFVDEDALETYHEEHNVQVEYKAPKKKTKKKSKKKKR